MIRNQQIVLNCINHAEEYQSARQIAASTNLSERAVRIALRRLFGQQDRDAIYGANSRGLKVKPGTRKPAPPRKPKKRSRRGTPLRAFVRNGVLTIEIGVDTLAVAALCAPFAFDLMGPAQELPNTRYAIKPGFATEVCAALTDELGEDGSSILTNAIDAACQRAVEDGSEYFVDREDRP